MDGRGGYVGGDGEEDWGEVEEKKQKNIERFKGGRDVFGRGCFPPFFLSKIGTILTGVTSGCHHIV